MKKHCSLIAIFTTLLFFGQSCNLKDQNLENLSPEERMAAIGNFSFTTTQDVEVNISAKDGKGKRLDIRNMKMYVGDPDQGGIEILNGSIDQNGFYEAIRTLPTFINEVVIVPNYIGVTEKITVPIVNNQITYDFTLPTTEVGALPYRTEDEGCIFRTWSAGRFTIPNQASTGNNGGVPVASCFRVPDAQDDGNRFLGGGDLNSLLSVTQPGAGLPEGKNNSAKAVDGVTGLTVDRDADVWVTFVGEGAGYRNIMGYYIYDSNNPPTSEADFASKNIKRSVIFPNASLNGSGGGLAPGDKVKIPGGVVPAGKAIAFFVIANGWELLKTAYNSGTDTDLSKVTSMPVNIFYSDPSLNPEKDASKKAHVALLNYEDKGVVLGFEDLHRDNGPNPNGAKCDNDFNDVIFYVTANPADAFCCVAELPKATPPPTPNAEYDCVSEGTLTYEDLWPSMGDFDMNDAVVGYKFNVVTDHNNFVKRVVADFVIRASGAGYNNGFAFEIPFFGGVTSGMIAQVADPVSGRRAFLGSGYTNSTIVVTDNVYKFAPGKGSILNVYAGRCTKFDKVPTITINFEGKGVKMKDIGAAPFNPFIISNGRRGVEVHLSGYLPTNVADASQFGKVDDDTQVGTFPLSASALRATPKHLIKAYRTKELDGKAGVKTSKMPFALHFPSLRNNVISGIQGFQFQYPLERVKIYDAYPKFVDWATSGGSAYLDWYLDKPGHINHDKIYKETCND